MAATRRASPVRRLWETIHEPRVETAIVVSTYSAVIVGMILVLAAPGSTPVDLVLGSLAAIAGASFAAASAWKGWWGVEGPAAGFVIIGLAVVVVEDVIRSLTAVHWPGWPAAVTLALCLAIGQRVRRVWGYDYEPSVAPATPLRDAERQASEARIAEADAVARVMEAEMEGGTVE